jgi:hypothetical protein
MLWQRQSGGLDVPVAQAVIPYYPAPCALMEDAHPKERAVNVRHLNCGSMHLARHGTQGLPGIAVDC